ncbi:MAG TPA: hypothetical protein VFQ44_01460 [Streptosporangiaceae bacterium]|nr:hypothetical protein [Streptosporangiaceae bacterium]
MDDIISGGQDRPPGSWRRRLLIGAALAAVAVALIVEHLPSGSHHAAALGSSRRRVHYRRLSPVPRPVPPGEIPAAPVPIGSAGQLAGILGRTKPWTPAARVPRAGSQPDWFWPAMGMAEPIAGLPRHEPGYVFTRVPGGWAIQPEPAGYEGCAGCPGQPLPVYYLANQSGTVRRVTAATMVAPGTGSQGSGSLWLTSYPAHSPLGASAGIAREYTASGVPAGQAVRLPAGYAIVQATSRGLLLSSMSARIPAATYLLWNPATRAVVRTLTNVLAMSGSEVAFVPACGAMCQVRVLNLATGTKRAVKLTRGRSATGGVFSPDGRYLALEVSTGSRSGSGSGSLGIELDVASVATGRLTMVPHTGVGSDALAGFGWPGNGDSLVAEFSFAAKVQVTLWSPGKAALAVVAVRPDQDPAALVIG